jgi:hypothetical protein
MRKFMGKEFGLYDLRSFFASCLIKKGKAQENCDN